MTERSNSVSDDFEHYCEYCKCSCDGFGELGPPKSEGHSSIHVVCKKEVKYRRKDWENFVKVSGNVLARGGKPHPTPPGRPDGAL